MEIRTEKEMLETFTRIADALEGIEKLLQRREDRISLDQLNKFTRMER